ncbi:MAG: hypothetical protein OEU92_26015, partial [Alphaproteobacteria bacterium]|nr:hypothetical protein [Alphaproteobacteria bacterium]
MIAIGASDTHACDRKRFGDGGPDAGAGTCNHGDLVGQALCGQSNLASLSQRHRKTSGLFSLAFPMCRSASIAFDSDPPFAGELDERCR